MKWIGQAFLEKTSDGGGIILPPSPSPEVSDRVDQNSEVEIGLRAFPLAELCWSKLEKFESLSLHKTKYNFDQHGNILKEAAEEPHQ